MEKIATEKNSKQESFEESIVLEHYQKKKLAKGLLNSAGVLVGMFLMFAVIVITTTDIRIVSFDQIAALSLDFFLLLFVSYSMYVTSTDSGMRSGLQSDLYKNALNTFESRKKSIVEAKQQTRLHEFCLYYINEELKNSRMNILAVVGFSYEEYMAKWVMLDKEAIEKNTTLTKVQKKAIISANTIRPVKLTPEMIMKRGRGSSRRAPLGTKPETKKKINFGAKFAISFLIAGIMSIIALDMAEEPSWVMFASCLLKLLSVVMNGVQGYKFGYENIVFDTADYITDQTDLMEQFIQYFEGHPEPVIWPARCEVEQPETRTEGENKPTEREDIKNGETQYYKQKSYSYNSTDSLMQIPEHKAAV